MPILRRDNTKKGSLLGLGLGRAQPSSDRAEQEALSASVNLEDIIDNYDGVSRRSVSSIASYLNRQFSQSYFSVSGRGGGGGGGASGNHDDDTTSFYTALTNGISDNDQPYLYSPELLWDESEMPARDTKQPATHFQVNWEDLTYKIKPKISLSLLWHNFEGLFKPSLSRINRTLISPCTTTFKEYNCASQQQQQLGKADQLCRNEPITIIQQINGSFKSGELTAVMGPSGAGKTSLLNFLSRRREDGYTGQLYMDNTPNRAKIGTIPQHDSLPEYLSVRENLMFASRLKNAQLRNHYDHEKNVQRVSNLLGLDECLDTRTKKISGGQQKRLAIAQELLSKPEILILDEPTSGLDSLTCYKTLSVLKNLVRASARKLIDPIAIVVTIHQPQQEVFEIFDKVYVMANGGIAIYNGPPAGCTQFIEQHSGVQMIDKDYNPASFLIEIASGEYGDEPIRKLQDQVRLEFKSARKQQNKNCYSNSSNFATKTAAAAATTTTTINSVSQYDLQAISLAASGGAKQRATGSLFIDSRIAKGSSMNRGHFWSKTCILSERCWLSFIRDPKQMIARILFHILLPVGLALLMGTEPGTANACPRYKPEYQLKELIGSDEQTSSAPQNEFLLSLENTGILFILVYALIAANIGSITLSFTLDMQRSLKEFYNGWYSMPSYIIARFVTELPMEILMPIMCMSLGYVLTGQAPGDAGIPYSMRIMITTLAVILGSMVGQTIGMIFGAIYIGHVSTALFASQGATLPMVFISGFVTRTKTMSRLVYLLSYASVYRHVLDIAVVARYGFNVCKCNSTMVTGEAVKLIGVSDRMKAFTQYWMNSQSTDEVDSTTIASSVAAAGAAAANSSDETTTTSEDLFQLFAKQISLYNTYGQEIRSCKDVQPFQLIDLSLNESTLLHSFIALVSLLCVMKALLFITVKLVIRFKTSL